MVSYLLVKGAIGLVATCVGVILAPIGPVAGVILFRRSRRDGPGVRSEAADARRLVVPAFKLGPYFIAHGIGVLMPHRVARRLGLDAFYDFA